MGNSAREDIDAPNSEVEGEEVMVTMSEMKDFTQALSGAVQMLNALVKKLNLDKERNEGIREIGNVIKGIVSSLDQCIGQRRRRRRLKIGHGNVEAR